MMHLCAQNEAPEPLSDFEKACRLIKDNLRRGRLKNELWTDGNWIPADLDDIMRRANMRCKAMGLPQFRGKPLWIV